MPGRKSKATPENVSATLNEISKLGFTEVINQLKSIYQPIVNKRPLNQQESYTIDQLIQRITDIHLCCLDKYNVVQEDIVKLQEDKIQHQSQLKSYANAVKASRVKVHNQPGQAQKRETLILTPGIKNSQVDRNTVRSHLEAVLKPAANGIRIDSCLVQKDGKVSLQLSNTASVDKIINLINNNHDSEFKFSASKKTKRKPLVQIHHVCSNLNKEELINTVTAQNDNLKNILEEKDQILQPLFSFRSKADSAQEKTWVFLTSPQVHQSLLKNRRVYIGLRSHQVLNYLGIKQCYNCCKFGHIASKCVPEQPACSHCGVEGHSYRTCVEKTKSH
ncbi:uncharacterized protein LOC111638575 [Centruroides sculpturatus]|uniref:uncharacterized protein LOC111638575 n=1 Tax=Centruroides sculpturatus TaxID=218467 RepID=UPI000C6EA4E4|nr:uncharacterized protein LOC111638575 [Centruroides sculpturatus]